MSPVTANAIVIAYPSQVRRTTNMAGLPTTRNGGNFSVFDPLDLDSSDFRNSGGGPKKRRRLTHLSPDEKLLRRKLKNRVAAQTARDRKRAQMAELEEKLAILEEENELLKLQNFSLKEASNRLAKENSVLICQLADQQLVTTETDSESKRSAAPCVPLLKERVQNLPRYVTQYIVMITLSLIISSAYYKNSWKRASVSGRRYKQPHLYHKSHPATGALHPGQWG
jgi:hypothetical protein